MDQGTICAKVYPEYIQPIKGNYCGLIPVPALPETVEAHASTDFKIYKLLTLHNFVIQNVVYFAHFTYNTGSDSGFMNNNILS